MNKLHIYWFTDASTQASVLLCATSVRKGFVKTTVSSVTSEQHTLARSHSIVTYVTRTLLKRELLKSTIAFTLERNLSAVKYVALHLDSTAHFGDIREVIR